ncbi:retrotransposon gag protein [Rhizoctonia solani 123E]|uniref:Retrotransposon gag protein n=1 Tax=Rhizoctonia solani 123E TaxID=1423351 RepID=A0A074RHU1_9AGAM|nr:retrotransposon gag protein [Rhizoctonia solani 123E]
MEDEAGDWAYPFLGELTNPGNCNATIRDLQTFSEEFAQAFSDPDEERVAARKIVELNQDKVDTKSTKEYTTKFKTLAAELSWNNAALMAQFSKGLHWKTKEILSQRERQPSTLRSLMNTAITINNVCQENEASQKKDTGKEKGKGKGKATRLTSSKTITETTTTQAEYVYNTSESNQNLFYTHIQPMNFEADPLIALIDSGATTSFIHP